ncbi:cytochrome b [uncultured Rhodoblastus sp.]|uniref:cytochrome b n=1 Tax=uncultured Rhodoblastus sp. TaxID=543037 RepID=UPI0025E3BE35|nr:cytochrome b [uncultured Rhodoblastus sp.]
MQDSVDLAPQTYDRTQIVLHWAIALLIFGLYAVGLSIDLFDKPVRPFIINLHAVFGLTLLLLVVVRIFWRLTHKSPPLPANMSPLFQKAAAAGHGLLYLLTVAIPLLGVPAFLYRGRPLDLGLIQIPAPFEANRDLAHQVTEIHGLLANILIALVVGHVLVALYHQFVLRDDLLTRMRPR